MAQFELAIYGENDEVVKKYGTNVIRWGLFSEALALHEAVKEKNPMEQIGAVSEFVMKIFPGLTREEINNADVGDVMNTFRQVIVKANTIKQGNV